MNELIAVDTQLWRAAGERVEGYLRAYRITDPALQTRLKDEIIDRAAARHDLEPNRKPVELAAEEVERRMREWIDGLIGLTDETARHRFARGRAAIYLTGLPEERPDLFLHGAGLPPEWLAQVRASRLEAGPAIALGNMVPRPLDLGLISSMAHDLWRFFTRWPALRPVTLCLLSVSVLGTAFFLVHP